MVQTSGLTATYTGNGVATAYSYPYYFYSSSHLVVTVEGTTQTLGTDYTVSSSGPAESGATVTFTTAPASGAAISITRVTPKTQLTDYTNNSAFPAASVENALDKMQAQIQELASSVGSYELGSGGVYFISTAGTSPNGVVTAARPSIAYDSNGALWVQTSESSSSTGWYQVIG